jgi:hypothetical protein
MVDDDSSVHAHTDMKKKKKKKKKKEKKKKKSEELVFTFNEKDLADCCHFSFL